MITIPGKVPIRIHPLFWLIALFIGWMSSFTLTGTLLAVLVILVSVLLHEFGHALTAMAFGQKTRIELAAFGGFTYRQGRKLKLWEEFLVVLDGPLMGLLLGIAAFLVWRAFPPENPALAFLLKFTWLANFFWTVINLVPVLPLDGGHLLSIILEAIFGFRGIKMAIIAGLVIAVSISAFFFVTGAFLIGALFLILTFESFRSLRYYKLFKEQDRDTDLQELMKAADAHYQQGEHEAALEKLERVREKAQEGVLYTLATQEMAEIYRTQGKVEEAYDLLYPIRKSLSGESLLLLHDVAFQSEKYPMVAEIGDKCYQSSPSYQTALINGLSYGALGEARPAVGWLECAQREGLPSLQSVIKKKELDPIRTDPLFQRFEASLSQS